VKWLIVATVSVYVLALLGRFGDMVAQQLFFTPSGLLSGRIWTLFTYTFLNTGDPFVLIFAVLGLWMLGGSLEAMWGTKRFVTFYFASSVIAALATAAVAIFFSAAAEFRYHGNATVLVALAAAFAVALPSAQIFLYIVPVQARLLLPISAGIIALFMIYQHTVYPYLPQVFGLAAGALLAGGRMRTPRQLLLRLRVFWIDRRLRSRNLRVVREGNNDEDVPRGSRGSDKYLH
jgi:membrane associated rhomboid family serine protease